MSFIPDLRASIERIQSGLEELPRDNDAVEAMAVELASLARTIVEETEVAYTALVGRSEASAA